MSVDLHAFQSIALQSGAEGIVARSASLTLHAATQSDMWALIADLPGPAFVHLTDKRTAPDDAGLAALCEEMARGNHDAAIARIVMPMARFLALFIGSRVRDTSILSQERSSCVGRCCAACRRERQIDLSTIIGASISSTR